MSARDVFYFACFWLSTSVSRAHLCLFYSAVSCSDNLSHSVSPGLYGGSIHGLYGNLEHRFVHSGAESVSVEKVKAEVLHRVIYNDLQQPATLQCTLTDCVRSIYLTFYILHLFYSLALQQVICSDLHQPAALQCLTV